MKGLIGIAVTAALANCSGCDETATGPADAGPPAGTLQPWTLGAARTGAALVLPPPCVEREPTLMAVLGRKTKIAAERHTLGRLWVAEGPGDLADWRADAAGVVPLLHGRTSPTTAPWPETGPPVLTRSGSKWLLAHDVANRLELWWRGESRAVATAARASALDCSDERCALLLQQGGKTSVMIGDRDDDPSSWRRVGLNDFGETPLAVAVHGDQVDVAMKDALRARFVSIAPDGAPRPEAVLGATPSLLALTMTPKAVLTEPPFQLVDGCPNEGGVVVTVDGHAPTRLRSPEPPTSAKLAVMQRGLLALWLAPPRCRSRRRMLHAAVIAHDGQPVAPVTTVAPADAVHVATEGPDVDLWLRRDADNTVTWVRARCR